MQNEDRVAVDDRAAMSERKNSQQPKGKRMTRTIAVIVLASGAALGVAATGSVCAQTAPTATSPKITSTKATDVSAQSRPKATGPRTRIRVSPTYPYRTYSTTYPVPYPVEYPGPGFVRQCSSWLAGENRVAGPVIVPKMRCWWQPGRSDLKSYP